MAGFDLAKIGLKPFVKPTEPVTNAKVDAPSVPSGNQVDVGREADLTTAPKVAAPAGATIKPAGLTFRIGAPKQAMAAVTVESKPEVAAPPAPVARVDVFDLAKTQATESVPTSIEAEQEAVVESTADGMRLKLDKLDRMIIAGSGIDQTSVDTARNYVMDIMTELKTHPEYQGVLIDKDVHNIMTFVRSTLSITQKTFVQIVQKREKATAKKAGTAKFDLTGFGDMSLDTPAESKQEQQLKKVAMAGLDAFANLNIDSITAKMKK